MFKRLMGASALAAAGSYAAALTSHLPAPVANALAGGTNGQGAAQAAGAAITTIGILTGQPEIALLGFFLVVVSQ